MVSDGTADDLRLPLVRRWFRILGVDDMIDIVLLLVEGSANISEIASLLRQWLYSSLSPRQEHSLEMDPPMERSILSL